MPAVVLEAACVPYGEGITFLPLRELAECAAALDEGVPELGELTNADAALAAGRTLFEHFTARGPVVVLDDVHWAVPTFLDLVEYVVRAVGGRLLVVCATRPELLELRPEWTAAAFTLRPLLDSDTTELVEASLERHALDPEVAERIRTTAEGVPLFLEQLVSYAAETNVSEGLPPTLESLLASRMDALEPGERVALGRAAVVGRTFSDDAIRALTPDSELAELGGRLASLARRRLVAPSTGGYAFVHALVRDAAYTTVSRRERADLHERLARSLEEWGAADELVGIHLERAALSMVAEPDRAAMAREAAARLGRAGRDALLAYDAAGARNLLERAMALLGDDDSDRLELACLLGLALKGLGRLDDAIELLEAVADRARADQNRRIELRARVEQSGPDCWMARSFPRTRPPCSTTQSSSIVARTTDSGSPAQRSPTWQCSAISRTARTSPPATSSTRSARTESSVSEVRRTCLRSHMPCAARPRSSTQSRCARQPSVVI